MLPRLSIENENATNQHIDVSSTVAAENRGGDITTSAVVEDQSSFRIHEDDLSRWSRTQAIDVISLKGGTLL